jgi:glycosyltransferase involved in cell wall biosynthesis
MFSFVIPVKNDLANLRCCLASLAAQDLTGCEVLVADDGSTPAIRPEDLSDIPVKVRLLRLEGGGPAKARNALARIARLDYLFFLDADTQPCPGLVRRAHEVIVEHPGIGAFFGSYDDEPAVPSVVSNYRNLLHHHVHQLSGGREVGTFWCGCGVVRRSLYLRCGGISETYDTPSIEDLAFGMRLADAGTRPRIVADLQVKHRKHWTLRSWIYTDLFRRGIPWVRLMRARKHWEGNLNFSWAQRVAAIAAVVVAVSLPAAAWGSSFLSVTAIALAMFVALNGEFFRLIARKRGWIGSAAAVPLHLTYAWICVASVALAFFYPPLELDYGAEAMVGDVL